jgi:regulator of chromosome condensation
VLFEEDVDLVEVNGGEHHSIALTKQGKVYCWGRNDEGQMGLGDIYGEYRRQKAQKEAESAAAEMKAPVEQPTGT